MVRTLEAGGTTLEESLALWERGEALAKVCQQWLDGARKRLDEAMGAERPRDSAGEQPEVGLDVLGRGRAVDEERLVAELGGVAHVAAVVGPGLPGVGDVGRHGGVVAGLGVLVDVQLDEVVDRRVLLPDPDEVDRRR